MNTHVNAYKPHWAGISWLLQPQYPWTLVCLCSHIASVSVTRRVRQYLHYNRLTDTIIIAFVSCTISCYLNGIYIHIDYNYIHVQLHI